MAEQRLMSTTLRARLLEWMAAEALRAGDRFPTEAEIVERWHVGRSTAREALRMLENDGVLVVERGRGRFVSATSALHVDRPISTFESVTSLLEALGFTDTTTTVLSVQVGPPSEAESAALGLRPDAVVIRLERLRAVNGDPLVYSVDVFDRTLLPGPVKHVNWSASLTELLAAHGHLPESSAARLEAVELPEHVAQTYDLGDLGPWLLITETVLDSTGTAVLFARDFHRGKHFAFNVARR